MYQRSLLNLNKLIIASLLALQLYGCGGGEGSSSSFAGPSTITVSGSVGDGPIVDATIEISDAYGEVIETTKSDSQAHYTAEIPDDTLFPINIRVIGGIDLVSGSTPEFEITSIAQKVSDKNNRMVVNINPFSTFVHKMKTEKRTSVSNVELTEAKETILTKLGFGIDRSKVKDPMHTPIDKSNAANMVRASESFGEAIRRTSRVLKSQGVNTTPDQVVAALASDMEDGDMDGVGYGSDKKITATFKVVSTQVLIETIKNKLKVDNSDAKSKMDDAIRTITDNGNSILTDSIDVTDDMLSQTKVNLAASQRIAPSANMTTLVNNVNTLDPTMTKSQLESTLSTDSEIVLDPIADLAPTLSDSQLNEVTKGDSTVNDAPRFTSLPILSASAGNVYIYDVNASDTNTGQALTFSLSTAPQGMTIDSVNGIIIWNPTSAHIGLHPVSISVKDNGSPILAAGQRFNVNVSASASEQTNVAPMITTKPLLTGKAESLYIYDVNANDQNKDLVSYTLLESPTGMIINAYTGVITWTPELSQVGSHSVIVQASDSRLPPLNDFQRFTVAISKKTDEETNIAPVITSEPVTIANQGKLYQYQVTATDANKDDSLVYSLNTAPSGMTINPNTGLLAWTPNTSHVGSQQVKIEVKDTALTPLSSFHSFDIIVGKDTGIKYRINVGGPVHIDSNGYYWSADYGFNLGAPNSTTKPIAGTDNDTIYQTLRYNNEVSDPTKPDMTWQYTVPNGKYWVKLHFSEVSDTATGRWKVVVENDILMESLDIVGTVGRHAAYAIEKIVNVTDGALNIKLPKIVNRPKLSAIEILSVNSETQQATNDDQVLTISVPEALSSPGGDISIITQPSKGSAVVIGQSIVFTPSVSSSGSDQITYMYVDSFGSIYVSTLNVQITCDSCTTNPIEPSVVISWDANSETITGYAIYHGANAGSTTQLVEEITLQSGQINVSSPKITYKAKSDLGYDRNDQLCISIKAYKDQNYSDPSTPVCKTIPPS